MLDPIHDLDLDADGWPVGREGTVVEPRRDGRRRAGRASRATSRRGCPAPRPDRRCATSRERLGDALPAPRADPAARARRHPRGRGRRARWRPRPGRRRTCSPARRSAASPRGRRIAAVAPPARHRLALRPRAGAGDLLVARARARCPTGSPARRCVTCCAGRSPTTASRCCTAPRSACPGGDGVLLLGAGGAGKSTTALACLEAGLDVVADDYCLVDAGAHARTGSIRSASSDRARWRSCPGWRRSPGRCAGRRARRTSTCASATPRPSGCVRWSSRASRRAPARAERVRGADVYRRMLASTLQQMPGRRSATLAALGGLIRALPAYELPVGPDLDAVVGRVTELCGA